ncbi:MAG: hypothetical protein ACW98F_00085 [Candidatus Hodarchaeales archaeon]|jgi:hypothetical protein
MSLTFSVSDISALKNFDPSKFMEFIRDENEARSEALNKLTKGSQLFLGSPILQAMFSSILGNISSIGSTKILEAFEEGSQITNTVMEYVAGILTIQDQMKLAFYAILVSNLKKNLRKRMQTMRTLRTILMRIRSFLAKWDLSQLYSEEWFKLLRSRRKMDEAEYRMRKVKTTMDTYGSFHRGGYRRSIDFVNAAREELIKPYINIKQVSIQEYYDKYKTEMLKEFQFFIKDVFLALSYIPIPVPMAESLKKMTTAFVDFQLRLLMLTQPSTLSQISLRDFHPSLKINISLEGMIFYNKIIRELVNEVVDFDITWSSFERLGKRVKSEVDKIYGMVSDIRDDMTDTLFPNPSDPEQRRPEYEIAFKNTVFTMQLTALVAYMKATSSFLEEQGDLFEDYQVIGELRAACANYPKRGEHPAEQIVKDMLNSFFYAVTGVFTRSGTNKARNIISDVIRKLEKAIFLDGQILGIAERFNWQDNALIKAAMQLFGKNIALLETMGLVDIAMLLKVGKLSQIFTYTSIANHMINLDFISGDKKDQMELLKDFGGALFPSKGEQESAAQATKSTVNIREKQTAVAEGPPKRDLAKFFAEIVCPNEEYATEKDKPLPDYEVTPGSS